MVPQASEPWLYVVVGGQLLISALASGHALLNKRESTSWVAVIWLVPFVGALLYAILGINRIQRRAHALRSDQSRPDMSSAGGACSSALLRETLGVENAHLQSLCTLVGRVTQRPLLHGNHVQILRDGDETYPAMLEAGCAIRLSPPPFDHSKLMLVDDAWVLVGSANWDARSLRLNFEFNLECYDREFVAQAAAVVASTLEQSTRVTMQHIRSRPLPVRLRDAAARTLSPFL